MKSIKAPCPACGLDQNSRVARELATSWADEVVPIDGTDTYRILMCLGCDTVFFGKYSTFSEDFDYDYDPVTQQETRSPSVTTAFFPRQRKRRSPNWQNTFFSISHSALDDLLGEVATAHDNDLLVLAAMGIRTCFDIASEALKIDQNLSFADKIEALLRKGYISPREKSLLEVLVDAGSAASHRGWKPSEEDVDLMRDALEGFIQKAIVLPEGLDRLSKQVPAKTKNTPK